jgi:hypothetical protein
MYNTIQTGPNQYVATPYTLPQPAFFDHHLFDGLVETLETTVSSAGGRTHLSRWIIQNTRDPLNPNRPWSFDKHEFQIGIADCISPRTVVMKASQLGVSELIVRIVLALLAKLSGRHAMYTLPDLQFAKKFSPTRFDPVITASPRLQSLLADDPNSNTIKRIGDSYLYIGGAHSERQSISVPASILVHDEVAYSNQEVLGTYSSRLGHLEEGQEIVYEFSTPLLPEHSIHKSFLQGTQESYAIYHRACNQWVILDPIKSIRIPNLDLPLELLTKADVTENLANISNAYIECPHCHNPISQENLQDHQTRAWIPHNQTASYRSFDANFLVLPAIKTPAKVLKDRLNYGSTEKWLNFAIGRPADSSDNRITETAIERAFSLNPSDYPTIPAYSVLGMDVGKTCHLTVATPINDTLIIVHTELVKQDSDNNSSTTFVERYKQFKAVQGVIDAGPEFTVTTNAQGQLPYNQVWGCYFTRGRGKSNLEFFEQKDVDGTVLAQRTRALDEFASDFNHGRILFRKDDPNILLIKAHLRALARITEKDVAGEDVSRWISASSDDHFFFSLFYAWLAYQMIAHRGHAIAAPSPEQRVLFGRIKMKS